MDANIKPSTLGTGDALPPIMQASTENTNDQTLSGTEKKTSETRESSTSLNRQGSVKEPNTSGEDWKAGRAEWMIIIVIAIVSLMVALDATILVPVLPVSAFLEKGCKVAIEGLTHPQAIATDLHGSTTDTFWTGTSYLLTQSVLQPFIVSLSDIFGRRLFYLISLAFFTIGTLLCCLSQNFTELLAGRSIQGIGGGGLLSLGLVIVTDIVPLRQRPIYVGINQIAWALGSVSGPLIGGLFVQHTTWRWIFYINFPFCGIGFLTVPLVMRLRANRASVRDRLLHDVDWIGGFLFVSSTCSFLIGVTWGGAQYPWTSWRTLVPMIVGVGESFPSGFYFFLHTWSHNGIAGAVCPVRRAFLTCQHCPKGTTADLESSNSWNCRNDLLGAIRSLKTFYPS